ncbi:MAG: RHS repeat-associated core domain-containing protein [Chloroflexota bacterium]
MDNVNNAGAWLEAGPVTIAGVTKYYHHGGQRIAMRQGDEVYYLHGDHLGPVSLTTDSDGEVVSEGRYLPYGEDRWTDGSTPTDFGFTAQRAERGFGLMDYNARYYSPYLGRFVSPDSMVPEPFNPQLLNRYSYVRNNPVRLADPTGHCDPLVCMNKEMVLAGGSGGSGARPIRIDRTGGGGQIVALTAIGLAALTIKAGQEAFEEIIETFPGSAPAVESPPGYGKGELVLPDAGLYEQPLLDDEFKGPLHLPSPGLEEQGPGIVPGFSQLEPGSMPNVFEANSSWFDEIYYNGSPIRNTRQTQRVRDNDVLDDLAEEYPHISRNAWRKVEQIFEYEDEEYDLHWFEAQGITERGKVERP